MTPAVGAAEVPVFGMGRSNGPLMGVLARDSAACASAIARPVDVESTAGIAQVADRGQFHAPRVRGMALVPSAAGLTPRTW